MINIETKIAMGKDNNFEAILGHFGGTYIFKLGILFIVNRNADIPQRDAIFWLSRGK